MPRKKHDSDDENVDDLDAELLSLVTSDKSKRKKDEDEEGQLSDENYEESKPLKKRKNAKAESVPSSDSEDEFLDGYDEDLMGDENDRAYLASLPEIQREEILTERYNKRKELLDLREYRKSKKRSENQKHGQSPSSSRTARAKPVHKSTVAKQRAMKDLRKKREEKQKVAAVSEDEEEEASMSDRESDDDYREDTKRSKEEKKKDTTKPDEEEAAEQDNEPITLQEVNTICLKRDFLEKQVNEPYFDEAVLGFFVRIGLGKAADGKPVYRLAIISGIKENSAKKYKVNKTVTYKYLMLKHGTSQKQFPIENVSNTDVSESEFKRWVSEMEKNNLSILTKGEAKEKLELLEKFKNYEKTEADIEKMLERNRQLNKLPINVAAEKVELMAKRVAAQDAGDMDAVAEISKKLEELDEKRAKGPTSEKTAKINERNKLVNITTKYDVTVKAADELHDPFSRRQTKPSPTFVKPKTAESVEQPPQPSESNNNNHQPSETHNGMDQLSQPVSVPLAPDHPELLLKSAHDFDIDLPSKPTDATVANPKPLLPKVTNSSNATTKPRAALSVTDYKIRRGLI